MPNLVAYVVFFSWPLVVYVIFKRMPLAPAVMWSMVLAYLFLPLSVGFDLPAVPTITKYELTTISVAVMCWLKLRAERPPAYLRAPQDTRQVQQAKVRWSRARQLTAILLTLLVATPVLTVLANSDPIMFGPRVLKGLRMYDAFSVIGATVLMVLPFWLGRKYLHSPESHLVILQVCCLAMMGYSLLALWEVRMSPQLNRTFYGFTSSAFSQHMRAGGFRPMVFMGHGLLLGIFLSMTVLAAAALWRHCKRSGASSSFWLFCTIWLLVTLVLAKSVGALLISLVLLPFVLLMGVRGQLLLAAILAGIVLLYPMLRGAGYIPTNEIHELVLERSPERAQSLKFRLDHEDALLARANERPLLGWGKWGRSRIFDPVTGEDLSVTDGVWIIIIGTSGWLGYVSQFGLLTAPILLLAIRRRKLDLSFATAGVAIVLVANLVDLLPNSALRPITWLLAGALMGRYIAASEATELIPAETFVDTIKAADVPIPAAARVKIRKRRSLGPRPAIADLPDTQPPQPPKMRAVRQRRRR